MDEFSKKLWDKVCSTIIPLGKGKQRSYRPKEQFRTPVLDLHGIAVHTAFERTLEFIEEHDSEVIVITGKSGIIKKEFHGWMSNLNVRYHEMPTGGAFKIQKKT